MKRYLLIAVFILFSCNKDKYQSVKDKYLKDLSFFKKEFVDHFPRIITNDNIPYQYQATVLSEFENIGMELSLTSTEEYINILYDSLSNSASAIYNSNDSCLLITNRFHNGKNQYKRIKLNDMEKSKINRDCYKEKLPIQNFYDSEYSSNETECNLPADFTLFVLEAQKGKYWDDKYLYGGKYMPPEWEYGYSKGIAVSKQRKIVIYWFVIW